MKSNKKTSSSSLSFKLALMAIVLSSMLVNTIVCSNLSAKARHGTHWNRIGKRFESLSYDDNNLSSQFSSLPDSVSDLDLAVPNDSDDIVATRRDASAFISNYLKGRLNTFFYKQKLKLFVFVYVMIPKLNLNIFF